MLNNINPANILQMVTQLKSNPMSFLGQLGIPQNISSDPQATIQNLMNRGVISQDQYNQAVQAARNLGIKI
ncbi:MAG: hypothetical protein J6O49_03490 [Bacteroidaceae bacterium]|nr:hypothetical protein [Bacteroidaceae bacterium]